MKAANLLLWFPCCREPYILKESFCLHRHVKLLVRYGVHREGNSEARHVCQPLHVPRRLQFWLHEWSTHGSFLQSISLQLWLVPFCHMLCHKQISCAFHANSQILYDEAQPCCPESNVCSCCMFLLVYRTA